VVNDLNGYLQWVEKLNDSTQFFTQHASFKSSERALKRLKELMKRAVLECETEYVFSLLLSVFVMSV
jgi:hypothetical protein